MMWRPCWLRKCIGKSVINREFLHKSKSQELTYFTSGKTSFLVLSQLLPTCREEISEEHLTCHFGTMAASSDTAASKKTRFRWDISDNIGALTIVQSFSTYAKASIFGQSALAWTAAYEAFVQNHPDRERVVSVSVESMKKHVGELLDTFKKDDNKVANATGTEEELTQLVSLVKPVMFILVRQLCARKSMNYVARPLCELRPGGQEECQGH